MQVVAIMSDGPDRSVDFDIGPLLEMPIELLREIAFAAGAPGSTGGVLMAKILRAVSYLLMYGHALPGGRTGKLPSGLTHAQAMERATELLDLADELDGLSSAQPRGGK